jgi:uncharacterized protein (DUF305 family)
MNKKLLIYSFVGLLVGSGITTVALTNRTQAQMGNPMRTDAPRQMMHTQRDRHFIEMMIPHHQDAIDMANLALSKAKRPEIKKLAQDIIRDQNREINQMKGWYKQWYGSAVLASSGMGANHGRHQRMGMMNMMSMNIDSLKNAADFDKAFIEQMIPHHKMAVIMTAMILDSNHPEMRNLAKDIIRTQSSEIEQMQQLYQSWYG